MVRALFVFLVTFVVADAFFAAAVIYHLRRYTLPGWTAGKTVVGAYGVLSLIFLGFAVYFLTQIPEATTITPASFILP